MNSFQKIITLFFPSKDVKILELRRIIKELKEENGYLKKEIEQLNIDRKINIRLYDEVIEEVIIENLLKAKKEICIAMAWLTSENILRVLNNLKNKGIDIKIIIDNNEKNRKIKYQKPCNVLKIADINTPYSKYKNFMHNKYCIIDENMVIDGSYNWSNNAKYNIEHIIVIEDIDAAKMYRENFYKIFNNQRYYANYTISENVI